MRAFLTILLSPAFIFIVYDAIFYWAWVPFGDYEDRLIYSLMAYLAVSVVLLIVTIRAVLAHRAIEVDRLGSRRALGPLKILGLVLAGLWALYMQLGGNITLDLEGKYSEINSAGIFYITLAQVVAYILIYDLYLGEPRPVIFSLVLFFVLSMALTGGRSGVIWWLLLIFFISTTKFRIRLSHGIFLAIFLVFFFVSMSVLRGTIEVERGDASVGFLDFNQIFTLEETLLYAGNNSPKFDLFLADIVDGLVPRAFNPDKNTSTAFTREVFPEVWERTSYTSGFYANLVFVFGNAGLYLAPLFQWAMTSLYLKSVVGGKVSKSSFLGLFFCLFPIILVRGGIFEFRVVFALCILGAAMFLHSILRKRLLPSHVKRNIA